MSKLNNLFVWAVGIVTVGFTVWAVGAYVARADSELKKCAVLEDSGMQVDCAFEVIETALNEGGLPRAFSVFSKAYQKVPVIAQTGCHRYSHRMGDLAYYRLYVPVQSMEDIEFVQETTACGYGFYHGFLEHLIQDRPDPAFVARTCNDLTDRLSHTLGDIRITCFHGSGHGFALAGAERVPRHEWGNVALFIDGPLQLCEALPEAVKGEVEECRQGVFNVLVDWMEVGQYGFAYDREKPFAVCDALSLRQHHHACYYEMAMKLDSVSGYDARRMIEIVKDAPPELARVAFDVGTAGLMQHVVTQEGGYRTALEQCSELETAWYERCAANLANGLFEHGAPQEEYLPALELCDEPLIAAQDSVQSACYEAVIRRLPRFYAPERSAKICTEFPKEYREQCQGLIARNK